jgi:hypothetical protein
MRPPSASRFVRLFPFHRASRCNGIIAALAVMKAEWERIKAEMRGGM